MSDLADFYSFDWSVADYAAETRRLRHAIRATAAGIGPEMQYSGLAVRYLLARILNPDHQP